MAADPPARADHWLALRAATPARIGLGRVGAAIPLDAVLDFQLAHARARDAVHRPLDVEGLRDDLRSASLDPHVVASTAPDRATYLRRPDLGRRLEPASLARLVAIGGAAPCDIVFVLADGLSPLAVQRRAVPLLQACVARLPGWRLAAVIATQARVALGDEIGAALHANLAIVLIGERPGLSVADSLGAYLTFAPQVGRPDSERNCVSNIHDGGLPIAEAADLLVWLAREAVSRGLTGVALKDERASPPRIEAAPGGGSTEIAQA